MAKWLVEAGQGATLRPLLCPLWALLPESSWLSCLCTGRVSRGQSILPGLRFPTWGVETESLPPRAAGKTSPRHVPHSGLRVAAEGRQHPPHPARRGGPRWAVTSWQVAVEGPPPRGSAPVHLPFAPPTLHPCADHSRASGTEHSGGQRNSEAPRAVLPTRNPAPKCFLDSDICLLPRPAASSSFLLFPARCTASSTRPVRASVCPGPPLVPQVWGRWQTPGGSERGV